MGDEGGFAPDLPSNAAAIEAILTAIGHAGFRAGTDVALALDVASSESYDNGVYELASEGRRFDAGQFADYLAQWVQDYPIVSIEDGMAEDDWAGWKLLTERLGHKVQLVGDDLFVTNTELLSRGIAQSTANAILIKPNQTDRRGLRHGPQCRGIGMPAVAGLLDPSTLRHGRPVRAQLHISGIVVAVSTA